MAKVDPAYVHATKHVVSLGSLEKGGVFLKLYDIAPEGADANEAVLSEMEAWADRHLAGLAEAGEFGFIIYHRCGPDFRFLLPSLWRGSNELWEAVWYRENAESVFAPFEPGYPTVYGTFRPTFCVWELGVVSHEATCWSRYLGSSRDAASRAIWASDPYIGPVR